MGRMEDLRRNLDKATMTGIEIGPFFNPVAPKSDGWKTITIDFCDKAALLEHARNHPADSIRAMADNIEDVDIVWTGENLADIVLSETRTSYDYFIASHVIEHTPDIIGFLKQVQAIIGETGILSMAVPDMRKCFDVFKPPSGIREALTAHRERRTRHTPETLFEARSYAVGRAGEGAWVSGTSSPVQFISNMESAWKRYRKEIDEPPAHYIDAHAWFFTPSSFELLMLELRYLGIIDLAVETIVPSDASEFIVQMRSTRSQPAAMTRGEFNAARIRLALQHIEETASEVLQIRRQIQPDPVPERRSIRRITRRVRSYLKTLKPG